MEHIIIDGGSTDGTVDIIMRYAEQHKHIRWVSEKDNGQSDAMNKGIRMAGGSVIGFLNVDDFYEPSTLREAVNIMQELPEPSLLVGNCNVWDNNGNLWFISRPSKIGLRNLLLERFMEAFPMNPSAYFYHKSLHRRIGYYEITEHYGMDLHFIFKAVQQASITYVDRTWGNYRYLKGTKTYEDDKNGGNVIRVKKITESYQRLQPKYYQFYLVASKTLYKMIKYTRNTLDRHRKQ
jgi:glycosyltransferase involved in cell wall biosynthesis